MISVTNQLRPHAVTIPSFPFIHSSLSYPDMPSSGTLRKSMFCWLNWFWDGTRGALRELNFGRAALGGRPCLCGVEYVMFDGWRAGALENLAAPFWCAVETENGDKAPDFCMSTENTLQMLASNARKDCLTTTTNSCTQNFDICYDNKGSKMYNQNHF